MYLFPRWSCEAASPWQEPIGRDVRRMSSFSRLWLMGQSWVTSLICVLPSKPSRPGWQEGVLSLNPVIATGKESIDTMKGEREYYKTFLIVWNYATHLTLILHVIMCIYRGKILQESLIKLVEACSDSSHSVDRWLSKLENSKWLSHVHSALSTAGLVVECVERWEDLLLWCFKGTLQNSRLPVTICTWNIKLQFY